MAKFQDDKNVRQAFEIEMMTPSGNRVNYTYEWNAQKQTLVYWNTTRDFRQQFGQAGQEGAWEVFKGNYERSIKSYSFAEGIFIGWVDPVTMEPIEDEEPEN
jgi:hypothetical protein